MIVKNKTKFWKVLRTDGNAIKTIPNHMDVPVDGDVTVKKHYTCALGLSKAAQHLMGSTG